MARTAADPGSAVLEARPAGGGDAVRRLGARPVRSDATLRWLWDGTATDGHVVPPGVHFVRLRATGTALVKQNAFLGR